MKTIYGITKSTFINENGVQRLQDKNILKLFTNLDNTKANLKFYHENIITGEVGDIVGGVLFEVTAGNIETLFHIEPFKLYLHGDFK